MEKINKLYLIFSFLILISGCQYFSMDGLDNKLKVFNNSHHKLGLFFNWNYPDTSFLNSTQNKYINPMDSTRGTVLNGSWEKEIKRAKYITIFFANEDSIIKYGENFYDKVTPLKKIVLNKKQLDSLGWKIYYP